MPKTDTPERKELYAQDLINDVLALDMRRHLNADDTMLVIKTVLESVERHTYSLATRDELLRQIADLAVISSADEEF